jgi:hypothetical protein
MIWGPNNTIIRKTMLVQDFFPGIIQELGNLRNCLRYEYRNAKFNDQGFDDFISIIPVNLLTARCFLDKITKKWRYEFGLPSDLSKIKKTLWGTLMWPLVNTLFESIKCASQRLTLEEIRKYMRRLSDVNKHQDTLVEMFPLQKLSPDILVNFEIAGAGNKDIDWEIGPIDGRYIRIDVKNRIKDLYDMLDNSTIQEPQHDHNLLFKSVESKFLESDPDKFLQGVWVVTQIKQKLEKLYQAFDALPASKVHFAII